MKHSNKIILRLGMAFVFFWFGINQINNPGQWVSYLPQWTMSLPIPQLNFVLLNGWFEVMGASLLVIGIYTRITALLLALHLFGIALSVGFDAVGVRDLGLAFATLSLAIQGAGHLSLDKMFEKSEQMKSI
jgi:uncharacterized membrane protein YphA (DoxX/SURF4 family)